MFSTIKTIPMSFKDIFENSIFFVRARKHRAQNRSVYTIHEDSSTGQTLLPLIIFKVWHIVSRKKGIFAGVLAVTLLLSGSWQIGQGTYIHSKAILAQVLLETAWAESGKGQKEVKPWPWADTWPVSRLAVPRLGISRIVLAGASGSSLAFGPGHLFGTALPGQPGNSVIAGHRDTHFEFLQFLRKGDLINVDNKQETPCNYLVTDIKVVNYSDFNYLEQTQDATLTLITCYPFKAVVTGGSLRFVVIAKKIDSNNLVTI